MKPDVQRLILLTQVRTLITELTDRLGDQNPWLTFDVDKLEADELNAVRRALHEALYAPPDRNR